MVDIFSNQEKEKFTSLVLYYNSLEEGEEKESLKEVVLERADMLLFFLPLRYGYLTEDDAIEFYIDQKDEVESFVDCYKISSAPFYNYLAEVIRKRCVIFHLNKYKKYEQNMSERYSDLYWTEYEEGDAVYDNAEDYIASIEDPGINADFYFTGAFDSYELSALSLYIIDHEMSRDERILSYVEERIKKTLDSRKRRKDFVILLLYIPTDSLVHETYSLSKVLSVEEEAMIKFFELKSEYSMEKVNERYEDAKKNAIIHYRSILRLKNQYDALLYDGDTLDDVIKKGNRAAKAFSHKIDEIRLLKSGLTQSEIADLLSQTRASVCQSVKSARKNLQKLKKSLKHVI